MKDYSGGMDVLDGVIVTSFAPSAFPGEQPPSRSFLGDPALARARTPSSFGEVGNDATTDARHWRCRFISTLPEGGAGPVHRAPREYCRRPGGRPGNPGRAVPGFARSPLRVVVAGCAR